MNVLTSDKLTVVLGEDNDYMKELKHSFINRYEYITVKIKEELNPYKHIGPIKLKNNKTILDIIMSDPIIKKYDKDYIISQLKIIGATLYMNRTPSALTTSQKLIISVFIDVFHGVKHFYFDGINDSNVYYYGSIFQFLNQSKEFDGGKAIWFSNKSLFKILLSLGNKLSQYHIYYFYNNQLIRKDFKDYHALLYVHQIDDSPLFKDRIRVSIKIGYGSISSNDTFIHINDNEEYHIVDHLLYLDDFIFHLADILNSNEDRPCYMMLPRKAYQYLKEDTILYK